MGFALVVRSLFTLPSALDSNTPSTKRKLGPHPRLSLFLAAMLLPAALAVSPLQAQTAHFNGAVTTPGGFDQPRGAAADRSVNKNTVNHTQTNGVNFGTVTVGTTSSPQTLYFTFTAADTGITASALTQGAKGLDFADAGTGTCDTNGTSHTYNPGDTCTVNVTFAPKYAGTRYGAAVLSSASAAIATAYLSGAGEGPQLVFQNNQSPTTIAPSSGQPKGLAVDAAGNLYVADTYLTGAVLEFPAGCHNCTPVDLGGNNSDYQVFRQPTAVALDGAGNIYVADFGDAAVKAMPPGCASSSCVTTLGGGFNQPYGVAVDGSGNVYVADSGNNTVKEIPPGCVSSNCVATLGGSFSEVTAVVVDGSGNVYVGDDGAVKEMPPGCSSVSCVTTVGSGFFTGTPLAVDGTGNLYASDGTVVKELPSGCASSNCVITLAGGSTKFYILTGLAVDGSGNVYVEDFYANRIYEWNLATVPSLSFADAKVGLQSGDSPQTVTLRNIGNAPLMFPAPGSGENPGVSPNFALDASTTCPEVTSSPSAGMLAAGASCNLAVDFIPTTSGPLTGPAVLTDNNLNVTDATQSMGLTGTGLATIITPTVTVTPYSSSVLTDEAASVQAVVSTGSGNPTPTGSVTLTSGSYTSAATTLTGGSANIYVPAGSLAAGNDTLTVTYTPDSTSSSTYTTATGTAPLTVTQAIGPCQLVGVNPNPNPESFNAPHDFNGDCKSDVLWRNSATGEVEIWFMNGTTFAGSASLGHVSSAWVIQDVDDFNADGYADILWRNTTTGEVYLWFMNGAMSVGGGSLGSVSSDWRIAGVGDFNGDGSADILWQNNSGELYLWLMNGTTIAGGGIVGNASSGWNVAGIGDFNGDGKADILWRNSTTGQVYLWFMNGSTMTGTLSPGSPTPDWVITAVGDFDLNGMSDILWRNTTTGQVYVWYTYDQGSEVEGGSLDYGLNYVSSDWVIQSVGNYDGGAGGILWRNRTTGEVNIWLDNENASGSPGTPNNTWQIAP